jgi:hypothetical protein
MKPNPGDLKTIEARFKSSLGSFGARYTAKGSGWEYSFQAPSGTNGALNVEYSKCSGVLR